MNATGPEIASFVGSERYGTPAVLFDPLNDEFDFGLDVAAERWSAKCERWYGPGSPWREDALAPQPWESSTGSAFLNPPFARISTPAWVARARRECRGGLLVVCVLPLRSDTRWWQRFAAGSELRLVRGRVHYEGGSGAAPFPTGVVVMRPEDPDPSDGPWQCMFAAPVGSCEPQADHLAVHAEPFRTPAGDAFAAERTRRQQERRDG